MIPIPEDLRSLICTFVTGAVDINASFPMVQAPRTTKYTARKITGMDEWLFRYRGVETSTFGP